MSKYIPLPPPQDVEAIPLYLQNELQKMSQALDQTSEEIQEGVADIEDLESTVSGFSNYTPSEAGLTKHYKGNLVSSGGLGSSGTSGWHSAYSTGDMSHTFSSSGSNITIDADMDIVAIFDCHADYYGQSDNASGDYWVQVSMYRKRNGVSTEIAGPNGVYLYSPTNRGDSTFPLTLAYHGSVEDGDVISIRARGLSSDTAQGVIRVKSASFTVRKV